jgi:hypothetical protein
MLEASFCTRPFRVTFSPSMQKSYTTHDFIIGPGSAFDKGDARHIGCRCHFYIRHTRHGSSPFQIRPSRKLICSSWIMTPTTMTRINVVQTIALPRIEKKKKSATALSFLCNCPQHHLCKLSIRGDSFLIINIDRLGMQFGINVHNSFCHS